MVRRITIVGLIIYCMAISPAFAGTWKDDFEDGNLDGWEVFNPAPEEKWGVEDGECSGQWPNDIGANWASGIELQLKSAALWKDYSMVVKVKLVERLGAELSFGIIFRALPSWERDDQEEYQATVLPDARKVFFFEMDLNKLRKISEVPLPFDISEDTWYELKVIAEGEHFGFYINDGLIESFDDDSRPSGTVWLTVSDAHVHFDDVVITGPEIPDGGPGFAVSTQSKLAARWGSVKSGR